MIYTVNSIKTNDDMTTNERITRWLERLEQQAEDLLREREPDELDQLSAKDRLTLAARYLALLQHFLQLAQRIEATTPNHAAQEALTKIVERMRGDWPLS